MVKELDDTIVRADIIKKTVKTRRIAKCHASRFRSFFVFSLSVIKIYISCTMNAYKMMAALGSARTEYLERRSFLGGSWPEARGWLSEVLPKWANRRFNCS